MRTIDTGSLLVLGVSLLLGGCDRGTPLGQVQGTVTLDGEPVEGATVIFQPQQGPPSQAVTGPDGRFQLMFAEDQPGATIGTSTVSIGTYRYSTDASGRSLEHPETIPARYNAETKLVREVQSGRQTIDFELDSD